MQNLHHTPHSKKVVSAFFSTPITASGKLTPRKALLRIALRYLGKKIASDCLVDNNRMLHPKEVDLIKNNAARFAKELYGTDSPTQDQVAAATSLLANTAQNLVDYNMGYIVPYSAQAETFLHTLQSEYAAAVPNLSIGNDQYLFYATNDQKNAPYINSGSVDKEIAGVIIKAPRKGPDVENGNTVKRDPATHLELDDKGRYSQRIIVDGKAFDPKYFPCPLASASCGGQNLDTSDPQTAAYLKALDKKIFKDIGTAATIVGVITPGGTLGAIAGATSIFSSAGTMLLDDPLSTFGKEVVTRGSKQYLTEVLNMSSGSATRIVNLIDLAGGWDAFISRATNEMKPEKQNSENKK